MFDSFLLFLIIKDVKNFKIVEGMIKLRGHIDMNALEKARLVNVLSL